MDFSLRSFERVAKFALGLSVASFALLGSKGSAQTWTPLTNQPSFYAGNALLLTDGTVLAQDADASDWWRLYPDKTGSYINGTWVQQASMPGGYAPLYYASSVLPDGKVVVLGGEYDGGNNGVWTNQGAIFDPVANSWTLLNGPSGWSAGDLPCAMLADGTLLVGDRNGGDMASFNENQLSWTTNVGTGKNDGFEEEGMTLLPDGSIFTVETGSQPNAQRYIPSSQTWVSAGQTPVQLVDPSSYEIGAQVLRPDGTVFITGATGNTALYTPPSATTTEGWTTGPVFPQVGGSQVGVEDGASVVLPNGNVLCAASPGTYNTPAQFFELGGTVAAANLALTPTVNTPNAQFDSSYNISFLTLPTGQILEMDQSTDMEVYTASGSAQSQWLPTVTNSPSFVTPSSTYTISGTQFNGLTQGSAYGDDGTNSTNYPLVRITNNGTGDVQYCKTHNHSTMAVATGSATVSTSFDVPSTIELGASTIQVVANGLASTPTAITVTGTTSSIQSLSLSPSTVTGGGSSTGTITLASPAPSGGWTVSVLSQSSYYVGVPSTVTVAAGATTATFNITTKAYSSTYTNLIKVKDASSSASATLTVSGDSVSSLGLNPSSVVGGNTSTGTITLSAAAPTGGWVVNLTTQSTYYVSVPSSVTVAAGATTATFTINTRLYTSTYTNVIQAADATTHQRATLTVIGDSITGLSLSPSSVVGGSGSTGTVTLATAAPTGGWVVTLSSQSPSYVGVPSSFTIPAGSTSGTFNITTKNYTVTYTNVIQASDPVSHQRATLTVLDDSIKSLSISPSTLTGGANATGTITLNGPLQPAVGWSI